METYSTIEKTKKAITYLVAYDDANGIETREGLYMWNDSDPYNRCLFFAKTIEEAKTILKAF